MTELYTDLPNGLCGNDYLEQTLAWYVLGKIGKYPAKPFNISFFSKLKNTLEV